MDHTEQPEYRRYTAVLREDSMDYAIKKAQHPRGKAIIEFQGDQCSLKCSVQNLRSFHEGDEFSGYSVWLVNPDEKIPLYAGIIEIDRQGVGESLWSFSARDFDELGFDIDSFNSLQICAGTAYQDSSKVRALVGCLELEEANLSEEPKMEKVSPFGTGMPYYQWWKFYPGYFENLMYSPSNPIKMMNENEQHVKLPQDLIKGKAREVNNSQACSGELNSLQTRPVFQGHQLVGLQCDQTGVVKYLVHGIPGRFCLRDQPYRGATGYTYWQPLPGQRYTAGDYGYWLIHVDPMTGEVVFPRRPTDPPGCEKCTRIISD